MARDLGIETVYQNLALADRFTILEHGRKLGDFQKEEVCTDDLIEVIRTGKMIEKKTE